MRRFPYVYAQKGLEERKGGFKFNYSFLSICVWQTERVHYFRDYRENPKFKIGTVKFLPLSEISQHAVSHICKAKNKM